MRCAVCVWVSGWRGVTACGFELHQCTTWNTHTLHKPQTQTCPNKIIHYKLISQHKFHTNIAVFFLVWFIRIDWMDEYSTAQMLLPNPKFKQTFYAQRNIYITDEMTLSMMPPTIVKLNATTNKQQQTTQMIACALCKFN